MGSEMTSHDNRRVAPPRRLSFAELDLVRALLAPIQRFSEPLQCQIEYARVVEECATCHSVTIAVEEGACGAIPTNIRVVATGDSRDRDGAEMSVLLHQRGGYLVSLEVIRADGAEPKGLPSATSVSVTPGLT